jgi:secreted trypsin-like serine protease
MRAYCVLLGLCLSSTSYAIVNGTLDDHNGVVTVRDVAGTWSCSGVYLGSGVVLTAAHCLESLQSSEQVLVSFADYVNSANDAVMESSSFITYQTFVGNSQQDQNNDLAFLFVDACYVQPGIVPLKLLTPDDGVLQAADDGTMVTIVGVGDLMAVPKDAPTNNPSFQRMNGQIKLTSVSSLYSQLDAPPNMAYPCWGDSGGPMLITRGGVEYVAGVASTPTTWFPSYNCGTPVFYTRVDVDPQMFIAMESLKGLGMLHSCNTGGGGGHGPQCSFNPRGDPRSYFWIPFVFVVIVARLRRRSC